MLEIAPEGMESLRATATIMMRLCAVCLGPLHKPLGKRALGLMFDPKPSHLDHGRRTGPLPAREIPWERSI